jgi:hypothetical protein
LKLYKYLQGDWSDESNLWTPELKLKLNIKDKDDGNFWISLEVITIIINNIFF